MKKTVLLLLTLTLVFALSGCFGNYREGYKRYSRTLDTYELYYLDLEDDAECPYEEGQLFTLYSEEGNTFMYEGLRSGDGCRVPLVVDVGSGFTSVANLLANERIEVEDIEDVQWTFDFVIDQEPDFIIGTVKYIEYFEQIGDYDLYVVDYGDTICHDDNLVFLFDYNDTEYNVVGAPTGNGCRSEYFIYIVEEAEETDDTTDDSTDGTTDDDANTDEPDEDTEPEGVLMTVNAAFQAEHISAVEIHRAVFESEIIGMYVEGTIMAVEASLYFTDVSHTYNSSNPYTLSDNERNELVGILATNRYRHILTDNDITPYLILNDINEDQHRVQLFDLPSEITDENAYPEESVIAVLTLTDINGGEHTYEIYESGIRIVSEDVNAFAEHNYQTFITDLLDALTE